MKTSDIKVGKIYLLVGGHILRYQGQWGSENEHTGTNGYCGAFLAPSHGLSSPATGYAAAFDDVLQEITVEDLNWLRHRRESAQARKLTTEVQELTYVIEELSGETEHSG